MLMWHLNVSLQGMLLYRTASRIRKQATLNTGINLQQYSLLFLCVCVYPKIIYEK